MRERARRARLVLPTSVADALVFGAQELVQLHSGIERLEHELVDKKREFKDLHATRKQITRDKARKQEEIAALRSKCVDLQVLKFGQEIDLDAVEKMAAHSAKSDTTERFSAQERQQDRRCQLHRKLRQNLLHQ